MSFFKFALLCGYLAVSLSAYAETAPVIWLGAGNSTQFRDSGTSLDYSFQLIAEARSHAGLQAGIGFERLQLQNRNIGDDLVTLYVGARLADWKVAPYINAGAGWYGGEFLDIFEPIFGDCLEASEDATQAHGEETSSVDPKCDSDVFLQYAELGLEIEFYRHWFLRTYMRRNRFDTLTDKYMSSAGIRLGWAF